ncbi:MAG TPA: marine proteobacterial sortase target protein [Polyangiaceae bacterium]|nr:marine proteobacterial sortase target protein [Polyangiaceae bacterium]
MKFAALFSSLPVLWPLWASAAPPPADPARPAAPSAPATAQRAAPGRAAPGRAAPKTPFTPDQAQAGALIFYDDEDDDRGWLAPEVGNDVHIQVTGMLARARVEQTFENLSDQVVHALYVFPLPETAAVDGLTLTVGQRRIVGEIREREAAARSYEQAQRQGKKASLIEQQRPNLFSTRVANIGPHEMVTVELHYQQDVRYDLGVFSLEFPSTLTPRYLPGGNEAGSPSQHGNISPPFALDGGGPALQMQVTLDAGVPLQSIRSSSHRLAVQQPPRGPAQITLEDGAVLADRDFKLEWAPAPSKAPTSAVFEESFEGERYALLMVLPPDPALDPQGRLPRETTFVIDTSGSMSGTSIEQARQALDSGLSELDARDHFNVVQFNSAATRLFDEPVLATAENVQRARRWVHQLQADGGTEMLSALELALTPRAPQGLLSQVVFVTDGSVANESDVFRYIQDHLAGRRLFTVGIGSAPNQYFMRSAARFGRGSFTSVASSAEVGSRMNELWDKLSTPVMSQLGIRVEGDAQPDVWPRRLPDLYRGEPLVVVAKLGAGATQVQVDGLRAEQPFRAELALGAAGQERGIHRLWARRAIEELMDRVTLGQSEEALRPQVTALALRHHLLSRYTSLVAVDAVRSVSGPGADTAVASALPAGNSMFGNMPQTATPAPTCLLFGAASVVTALVLYKRPRAC